MYLLHVRAIKYFTISHVVALAEIDPKFVFFMVIIQNYHECLTNLKYIPQIIFYVYLSILVCNG